MKLINNKSILYFLLFVVLFTACKKIEVEEPELKKSELSLLKYSVLVAENGGDFEIGYEIKNPQEDEMLELSSESEWINNFDTSENSVLGFSIDKNTSDEMRKGIIKVRYSNIEKEISVEQKGLKQESEVDFKIQIENLKETSASARVLPNDTEMGYTYTMMLKSQYKNFESDEALFQQLLAQYKNAAKRTNMPFEEFMKTRVLKFGEKLYHMKKLSVETEYCFVVIGMNTKGEKISDMYKEFFKTKNVNKVDITFDLNYEIDGPDVKMSIKPSIEEQTYYYAAIEKEEFEKSGLSLNEYTQRFIYSEIKFGEQVLYMTPEVYVKMMLAHSGTKTMNLDYLNGTTDYIGYVCAIDKVGVINSEIERKDFSTGVVPPSNNVIDIVVNEVSVDTIGFTINTSNKDSYVTFVKSASEFNSLSDAQILEKLTEENLNTEVRRDVYNGTAKKLNPDEEYFIFAFGYRAGTVTTELVKSKFKTLTIGNPEDLEFEFNITEITSSSAKIQINANPFNALYYWVLVDAEMTENQAKKHIDDFINQNIKDGNVSDRADFMKQAGTRGDVSYIYGKLKEKTSYKVLAVGVYDKDGTYATDFISSDVFTTLERKVSSTKINVSFDKYFDGTEVSENYSNYDGAVGLAVVPLKIEIDGDYVNYYTHILYDDLTNEDKYSDESLIEFLISNGIKNVSNPQIFVDYDKELTILSVVEDRTGKFSKVYRQKILLTEDGASPISEFTPNSVPKYLMLNYYE